MIHIHIYGKWSDPKPHPDLIVDVQRKTCKHKGCNKTKERWL